MMDKELQEIIARAIYDETPLDSPTFGFNHDHAARDLAMTQASAVMAAIRSAQATSKVGFVLMPAKLIADAADYLIGDAEAWEKGSDGNPHEVYLKHCGKLRRDIAQQLRERLA